MGRCHTLAGVAEPTPLGCAEVEWAHFVCEISEADIIPFVQSKFERML